VKTPKDFDTPQLRDVMKFLPEKNLTLYEGKKCEVCGFTGYKGRTSIYEVIKITPTLQELIVKRPSAQEIWALARKEGAKSVFEDGLEKVKNGLTSIEELVRIAPPPDNIIHEKQSATNAPKKETKKK
jgi:type II secretory ATPase GspE/PulE/Tfp pilus assembly ATPase PilB-like protein